MKYKTYAEFQSSYRNMIGRLGDRILPNFLECFYKSIELRRTCLLFLLENSATIKKKNLFTVIIKI